MSGFPGTKGWIDRLECNCERCDGGTWYTLIVCMLFRLYRFIQITIREFLDDRLLLRAMALTFATLLSIIPLLFILFGMFRMFGGGEWFVEVLRPVLMRNLAPGSGPVVAQRIEDMLIVGGGPTVSGIGLLFLVLAVYGIFTGIESTFNLIWGASSKAGALRRLPLYWGLVTIIPILVVSSLALTTFIKALPLVHQAVEKVGFVDNLINRLLPGLMVVLSFFLLYRFLPNTRVRTLAALVGAVTAGVLYEIVKYIFIFYTRKLVQYDVIYGSMAIIPSLMVWVNLSWIMVLLGVEICYVTQHYSVLLSKRKHVEFSRPQKDSIAYLILTQITLAFRGKRKPVTVDEWSHQYGVPPGTVLEVVERLRSGGILERTGSGGSEILLTRDPDYIKVGDIDRILTGESLEEWEWPNEASWRWLRTWTRRRSKSANDNTNSLTLGKLVSSLEEMSEHPGEGRLDTPV